MAEILSTTQEHLDIEDIKNDFIILKTGTVAAVLQTTAVNFELLSEIEQDAIIAAFSMLLNSINFPIQVVVRSKKVDISKYIDKVSLVEAKQTDPLLKAQASAYKRFVQQTVQNNEVLDKKFYVIVPSGEGGIIDFGSGPFDAFKKLLGMTSKRVSFDVDAAIQQQQPRLAPKIEHIISEFNRIGVRTKQLTTQELVELYFDIYNPSTIHGQKVKTNISDYKAAIVSPAIVED